MQTLYQRIYAELYEAIEAGKLRAGDRLPTERELCRAYGVSRITACRALNELRAQGLIERKKKRGSVVLSAPLVPPRKTGTIAVVFSDFDQFGRKILAVLGPFAQKHNYTVATFDSAHSRRKEREILRSLIGKNLSGLILWPITRASNLDLLYQFERNGIPLCFLDYSSYGIKAPCVSSDNYGGMYSITKYLIGLGHTRIAYFPFKENFLPTEEERFSGYCRALAECGAVPDPKYFLSMPETIRNTTTENAGRYGYCARYAVERLAALPLRPTAVVCVNDATACHIVRAAREKGLRVPQDLSVTGFDDTAIAVENDLTTVSQDFGEMAKLAFQLLLRRIEEPTGAAHLSATSRLRSMIWERGSTCRLN